MAKCWLCYEEDQGITKLISSFLLLCSVFNSPYFVCTEGNSVSEVSSCNLAGGRGDRTFPLSPESPCRLSVVQVGEPRLEGVRSCHAPCLLPLLPPLLPCIVTATLAAVSSESVSSHAVQHKNVLSFKSIHFSVFSSFYTIFSRIDVWWQRWWLQY